MTTTHQLGARSSIVRHAAFALVGLGLVALTACSGGSPRVSYGPADHYRGSSAPTLSAPPPSSPRVSAVSAGAGASAYKRSAPAAAEYAPSPRRRASADDASGAVASYRPAPSAPAARPSRSAKARLESVSRGAPEPVTIHSVRPTPPPPVAITREIPQARAKLLTAASVGDHDRFGNYLSYLQRHSHERHATGINLDRRIRVRVLDAKGNPINDAGVAVALPNQTIVHGRTHADGRWAFFPSFSAPGATGSASLSISVGRQVAQATVTIPRRGDGQQVTVQLPAAQAIAPRVIDLGFVIDVTGSMGDELRYVNREIADIVRRVKGTVANTTVRVGAVFYRDRTDAQRLQMIRFTTDVVGFGRAMQRVHASGGGDYPEDMNAGLELGLRGLRWSTGNAVRVMVLLADAPPKHYADATFRYNHAMIDAAKRGIRILPVAASGANRTVEYLFRAMGAFTSTPYTYLTDDSGVGGKHMEADTDRVGVERFNDLLTRLVISDLRGQGMHEPGTLAPQ